MNFCIHVHDDTRLVSGAELLQSLSPQLLENCLGAQRAKSQFDCSTLRRLIPQRAVSYNRRIMFMYVYLALQTCTSSLLLNVYSA